MVHIKEPLLLIGKSIPCGSSGFPLSLSEWSFTICLMPYNSKYNVLETHCLRIVYSFRLAARVLLHAPSHRQDNTYHSLCYTSRGALAGTINSSMDPKTHHTMSESSYHGATTQCPMGWDMHIAVTDLLLLPETFSRVPLKDQVKKIY